MGVPSQLPIADVASLRPSPGAENTTAPELAMVGPGPGKPLAWHLIRLARPTQWAKGAFVLVGPLYAAAAGIQVQWIWLVGAVLTFGFASSACYIINDLRDREADRAHPRKCRRPIASGVVPAPTALVWAASLIIAAGLALLLIPGVARVWVGAAVGAYVLNVLVYSLWAKHVAILDVISLAAGFVLRVLGGCAAAGVAPSSWLLNCIFFLSMFLAFGKRLGERQTLGEAAAAARGVQSVYTDALLRMTVVVTAVATLITYAGYVQSQEAEYTLGFNLLWLTMLPATYALLRCFFLLEGGAYDDPTELASRDRPFQAAVGIFVLMMALLVWAVKAEVVPGRGAGAVAANQAGSCLGSMEGVPPGNRQVVQVEPAQELVRLSVGRWGG